MRRMMLLLTVTALVVAGSSAAFADDEARDAMITYSGTEAFTRLLPEERQACMYWVAEGGKMNETCRGAVVRLISDDPEAVTPSQRKALLAAASGKDTPKSASTTPAPDNTTTVKKSDNTGAIIAAGVIGIIAGMVIHNNWPRNRDSGSSYGPPPPRHHPMPPRDYRPGPGQPPHPRNVSRQSPPPSGPRKPVLR